MASRRVDSLKDGCIVAFMMDHCGMDSYCLMFDIGSNIEPWQGHGPVTNANRKLAMQQDCRCQVLIILRIS